MKDLLYCKDLYGPLQGDSVKPISMTNDEWKRLDRKTVGFIRQWLDDSVFHHVSTECSAYSLWKKLESLYERKTVGNKAFLIRELVNLKYKEGTSIPEHLNEMQSITNQLSSMKMPLDDELQALLLLSSLLESWETLVVSLSNSAPDGIVTMSQVTSSLLNEELRRKNSSTSQIDSQALVSENRGRSKSKDRSGSRVGRSKSRSRKDIVCYNCGEKGHYKNQCKQPKKNKKRGKEVEHTESKENITATVQGSDYLILSTSDDIFSYVCQDLKWIIDTGASYHATPRREFFATYRSGNFGVVKMGNYDTANIIGMGDIHIKTNLGCKLVLKDVRHVVDLRLNLISVGRLDDEDFDVRFHKGQWKLSKGSLIVANGKKYHTLYRLQPKACGGQLNATEKDSSMELWHRRLGHMSEKGLQELSKREVLPSLRGTRLNPCIDCLAGKQHRVSFVSPALSRKMHALDRVYTDVCGPLMTKTPGGSVNVPSISGALYFVTFIDDFSRKVWAYALKTKDHVINIFKEFHARVERETERQLKCIRSDNGGEYIGLFNDYCRSHGIQHELIVPGTPQHNAIAERMNRTIMKKIRCMLSQAKLPKRFWDEALRTAVDVINLSPCTALDGDVAEHVWSGKDVSYRHLRVFGCRAFAHVPNNERSKLDDQIIEDLKEAPTKTSAEGFVDCDPVIPPVYQGDGGDVQEDGAEPDVDIPAGHVEQEEEREQVPTEPQLRRSSRQCQPSRRYSTDEYVMLTDAGEPESYQEAVEKGSKALKNKWVFRLKTQEYCSQPKYKARLVVKGFGQKKAFLHGDLEEEIYMEQPEGFKVKGKENLVCKLKKSLYGLKQALRQWYKKFISFMIENKYKRTASDHCVYIKRFGEDFIILLLYVDDMLILGKDMSMIDRLKKDLSESFAMKDMGPAKQILGMQISRDRRKRKIWLSQEKYIEKVLDRFSMSNAKPVGSPLAGHFKLCSDQSPSSDEEKEKMQKVPYASAVGSLMYAMVCTRPNIAYAVGVTSRFLANPGKEHWAAVKWIFRYLKGSSKICLSFGGGPPVLTGYTDADMARDIDTRKSTSGFVLTFAGGAVSWQSRLQRCIALSTTEAEYIAGGLQRNFMDERILTRIGAETGKLCGVL
ncbi:hypothetical protein OPV22_029080 [Ensete ventricosum]|uniref:Uncharacterized protein n=1 Tax=Ensete ventricosum TaxID=4639 RepID=A0AAV8Q873_ENSVE|nr:hypothetical protein OPV22_029080 [Ensete ventricosum]